MALTPQSRNPFADPGSLTLADLIKRVQSADTPPLTTRQNWRWALKTVARAAGKDPTAVPAHPQFLRKVLELGAPEAIGLGRAAWNNARSMTGKVLEWAGLASVPGHYLAPFAPAWAELWAKLPPDDALRHQLGRLFHYASAQGIAPGEVNDAMLATFHEALISESIVPCPYEIYRSAAKSWNNAAERIPDWPQTRLSVPSRKQSFSMLWSDLPPTLTADIETYLRRAAKPDLSDDMFTRAQRPATIETRRKQLRRFVTALLKSGIAPSDLVDLRAILVPEVAARGLEYLIDRNGGGASSVQISNIADFLPTLARRLGLPKDVIGKLDRMKTKLKITQHGMTARNREALRAFDDRTAIDALVTFSRRVVRDVQTSNRAGYREAKMIQTALAVELLLNSPVRIQNLAAIELERHLIEVGYGSARAVHLRFPACEVKNRNDLEFPLMPESITLLDIYISNWRSKLSNGQGPFLFPGKAHDQHKGNGALSSQIKGLVYTYTRLDMPAHRFRHAAAKIFLDSYPGQYEVVRQLLGHKDIRTTISFYAGAESASAARHYANTILDIRNARQAADDDRR
jgi:integrase